MTPADLKSLRLTFRWSQSRLAEELDVTRNTIQRWESGTSQIPVPVQRLLEEWQRRQFY